MFVSAGLELPAVIMGSIRRWLIPLARRHASSILVLASVVWVVVALCAAAKHGAHRRHAFNGVERSCGRCSYTFADHLTSSQSVGSGRIFPTFQRNFTISQDPLRRLEKSDNPRHCTYLP